MAEYDRERNRLTISISELTEVIELAPPAPKNHVWDLVDEETLVRANIITEEAFSLRRETGESITVWDGQLPGVYPNLIHTVVAEDLYQSSIGRRYYFRTFNYWDTSRGEGTLRELSDQIRLVADDESIVEGSSLSQLIIDASAPFWQRYSK